MAVAKNDITGDKLISRNLSEEGAANWDAIFPPKKKERYIPPPLPTEELEEPPQNDW